MSDTHDTVMAVDPRGLAAAIRALSERLGGEAISQNAYFHLFDDGRLSMELEWLDLASLAQAAVAAYLGAVDVRDGT